MQSTQKDRRVFESEDSSCLKSGRDLCMIIILYNNIIMLRLSDFRTLNRKCLPYNYAWEGLEPFKRAHSLLLAAAV